MENMKSEVVNCTKVFSNGVAVVNTTPHPINFIDGEQVITVPSSNTLVVNASPCEEKLDEILVKTIFLPTEEGTDIIRTISEVPMPEGASRRVVIGSIIAAQAYPGMVVAMTPAPGYERVAPAEKRMSISKFTVY